MSRKREYCKISNVISNVENHSAKKRKMNQSYSREQILSLDDDENNDHNEHQNDQMQNISINNSEPITLNVGGIKYQTTLATLLKYDHSFFHKMFNGKFSLKPNKDGSYFIDRNGKYFEYILDYLRSGILMVPPQNKKYLMNILLIESSFYGLTELNKAILSELKPAKPAKPVPSKILNAKQIDSIRNLINEIESEYKPEVVDADWTLLHRGYNFYFETSAKEYQKIEGVPCLLFIAVNHMDEIYGFFMSDNFGFGANSGFMFSIDESQQVQKIDSESTQYAFTITEDNDESERTQTIRYDRYVREDNGQSSTVTGYFNFDTARGGENLMTYDGYGTSVCKIEVFKIGEVFN